MKILQIEMYLSNSLHSKLDKWHIRDKGRVSVDRVGPLARLLVWVISELAYIFSFVSELQEVNCYQITHCCWENSERIISSFSEFKQLPVF